MACSIIPAVLQKTKEELDSVYSKMAPLSHKIHIDATDGLFTPYPSYPYTTKERHHLLPSGDSFFSVHLMVRHPFEIAQKYISEGAKELIVHVESFETETQLLKFVHAYKPLAIITLAVAPGTAMETLYKAINTTHLQSVMIMTLTDIGRQGSEFDRASLLKIKEMRAKHPKIRIATDGSINATNIYDISFAGADECVIGSALVKSEDPRATFEALSGLVSTS